MSGLQTHDGQVFLELLKTQPTCTLPSMRTTVSLRSTLREVSEPEGWPHVCVGSTCMHMKAVCGMWPRGYGRGGLRKRVLSTCAHPPHGRCQQAVDAVQGSCGGGDLLRSSVSVGCCIVRVKGHPGNSCQV